MIPGAMMQTNTMRVGSNICGLQGLATRNAAGATTQAKSVCSKPTQLSVLTPQSIFLSLCFLFAANVTPFILSFRSDAFEGANNAANVESTKNNPGFMLGYTMDATNCAAMNG
jgi:hypothetical protein